ncbi:B3 domain-containing protein At2g33720-like [Gastrolobium bilobum]|uniref:B3 domain-containing protein At2g33720-like n=1 Tax=Gastrolobium bilobum TaxID=150636 RepID=UPI002AB0B00D|nr:B3 domain-containing protein At2g33720-like [Gastrolobium bilobum]
MSNPSDEREQCQKKRKSTSCEGSTSRTSRRRLCSNKNEEEKHKGVSTTLKLYDDPWTIKKTLTDSDLGILSRLLLAADLVKKQILPMLEVDHARAAETDEGTPVRVRDIDTKSMHQLVLKRWSSSKSYVLIGKWNQDFVRRRELKKGDEIGFHWDPYNCTFNFCVLKRAIPAN